MKGVIKDGVRSAFVRLIRYIVFGIIALIIFYIVGAITNKKASALVAHGNDYDIPFVTDHYDYTFTQQGDSNYWFNFNLQQDMEITNDYDLMGFKFNKINTLYYPKYYNTITSGQIDYNNVYQGNVTLQPETWVYGTEGVHVTFNGIMFDDTGYGHICYLSSEAQNTFLCPITRGMKVRSFALVVNASVGYGFQFNISMEIERNKMWYNYDATEIINSNGQIVNQQTITNNYIQDNNTTTTESSSTNQLSQIQTDFSQKLSGMNELTQAVLSPVNAVLTATSTSCSNLEWDIPFVNTHASIPCLGSIYNTYFRTVITLFATIITGIYAYRTIVRVVSTFKDVLDVENDKIEVIDL